MKWVQGAHIVVTRRACREISLYDVERNHSDTLATLPYFVDSVLPCSRFRSLVSRCKFKYLHHRASEWNTLSGGLSR